MIVKKDQIASIIVLYKFTKKSFEKILKQHLVNFSKVILVNNSAEISLDGFISKNINIINNSENLGLAKAINIGINEAEKYGFEMVALFDQDTYLPNDFLSNIIKYINNYDKPKKNSCFCSCLL